MVEARSLRETPNNLPAQATPFIERGKEVARASALVKRPEVRLLTLTGPGGTGKTRLGLQVAFEMLDQFDDGAYFVPLAPISDPTLVAPTIARTLGVKEVGGQPLTESLRSYLRDKRMLLLLDNFEQVLKASPLLADLLADCPYLKLLITSRSAIHIYGQHEFPVPPMSLPPLSAPRAAGDHTPLMPLSQLSQYEAVRLFVERAVAVKPDFAVTNENAPAVAEICHRLDGLPLAIELAATRIKILSPQAMLVRLQSRLKLLTGGAWDLPARQQTLRGAIEWSYDLLEPQEQTLFRRLSVFVGGCSLDAAEQVCGLQIADFKLQNDRDSNTLQSTINNSQSVDLFDVISSLVDKSLLRQEEVASEPRFWMLETIREYALEKLAEHSETSALRARHSAFFLALTEEAEPKLRGPEQLVWLTHLEREHDNIRAAMRWSVESEDAESGLRMAGALSRFWYLRGHMSEGRQCTAEALATPGAEAPTLVRAKALYNAGYLASLQGDLEQARLALEESLLIRRELGDRQGIAASLNELGSMAYRRGDYPAARTHFEESLAVRRTLEDKRAIAIPLNNLGVLAVEQGDYARARELYEEGLVIFRDLGDNHSVASLLHNLGIVVAHDGDYATARALYEESLSLRREFGDKYGIAHVLYDLGIAAQERGDYSEARALYEESLAIRREVGDKSGAGWSLLNLADVARHAGEYAHATILLKESWSLFEETGDKRGMAECLVGMGGVAAAQSQPHYDPGRATRLFGASEALFQTIGAVMSPIHRAGYEHNVATLRTALGNASFTALWAEGQTIPPEEITTYALEEREATPETTPTPTLLPTPTTYPGGLSEREVDVLRLVAAGLTNAQAAEKLVVSPFTINAHLRSIYSKLGITSRSAVIRFAIDNNLV